MLVQFFNPNHRHPGNKMPGIEINEMNLWVKNYKNYQHPPCIGFMHPGHT